MVDLNLVLEEYILFKLQHTIDQWFVVVFHALQVFLALRIQWHFLRVGEKVIIFDIEWFGILAHIFIGITVLIAVMVLLTKLIDVIGLRRGYLFPVVLESILVCTRLAFLYFLPGRDNTFTLTFFRFPEIHTGPHQLSFNRFISIWSIDKFIIQKLQYIMVQTVRVIHTYILNMRHFLLGKVTACDWLRA